MGATRRPWRGRGDMQFDHDLRTIMQRGFDAVMIVDYGATIEGLAQLREQFAPQLGAVFKRLFADTRKVPATTRRRRSHRLRLA
jgi:hypothetical protein